MVINTKNQKVLSILESKNINTDLRSFYENITENY